MERLAENILKHLNNEHTKVEVKQDFKGNYYSYINDTIYISDRYKEQKTSERAKSVNKYASQFVVMCHECKHSVQNKYLHILNIIFSNLAIICTFLCVGLGIFTTNPLWIKLVAMSVIFISIILRIVLEIDAINGSLILAKYMVENNIVNNVTNQDIQNATQYIQKYKWLALLQMISDKIAFQILIILIK